MIVGMGGKISVTGMGPEYILTNDGAKEYTFLDHDSPYRAISMGGSLSATPVIADILDNGSLQMIVADEQGNIIIGDEDANALERYKIASGAEASCFIRDIDGDGKLELLIADLNGYLYCYDTKSKGEVFWGSYRGNSLNTGVANMDR